MIKLFNTTDNIFTSNGDKVIIPTRAEVYKEDNGSFYLSLETLLDYIDDLTPNKILVANTPQGDQAFRITNVDKTRTKISLKAYHISYDANNYLIKDTFVVNKTCNQALGQLNNATDNTSPFNVSSDITNTNSYRCVRKSLYQAWQVVLERWGGHLVRDNFNVSIMNSIGADNGVTIRYGKNLKDISVTYNWDDVVTKLLPVGQDGLLLPEVYVTSTTQYDIPYTKSVNFDQSNIDPEDYTTDNVLDQEAYEQALEDDLRAKAQAYVNENCLPKVSYTLKANLERISDVGDTIEVIDEKLGINLTTHLLSYNYDCILQKYVELEFGNFTNQLSNLLSGIATSTTQLVNEANSETVSKLEGELQTATQQIWGVLGNSYVIYDGDKILIVDSLPKETATNVIMINAAGIGFSNTGISGTFNSAWSINGTMNMQNINVINLVADMISGGDLKLTSNTISISSTNFNVDSSGNLTCANADVSGKITADSGEIAGYEIGYDNSTQTRYLKAEVQINYDYDDNDISELTSLILSGDPPTTAQLDKYDFNKSGTLNITDLIILKALVSNGADTSHPVYLKISSNPDRVLETNIELIVGTTKMFSATTTGVKVNNGDVYGQRVLFEDANGDSGTIQLSDDMESTFDISSYQYLEVFGIDNNDQPGAYVKLTHLADNGTFMLQEIEAGTNTYIRRTKYTISTDELVPSNYGYVYITSSGNVSTNTSQNYLKITKVVGYK